MRAIPTGVAVAVVACALVGGTATAQSVDQVNVQGQRPLNTKIVGRTSSGIPVADVSLSYDVRLSDLPASSAGSVELARRIDVAAEAACREISRRYPDATPSDAECAREAAGNAMVKARELVPAAHGR
jgi:hypothetical protein